MDNTNLIKEKLQLIEFRWFIIRLFFETKLNKNFFNYIKDYALNGHDISLILFTILKHHDNQKYIRAKVYFIFKNNKDFYNNILKEVSYVNHTPIWFDTYDKNCDEQSYNSSWEDIITNSEKIHFLFFDLYNILSTHHENISEWTDIPKIIINNDQTKQLINNSIKKILLNFINASDNKNTSIGGLAKSKKHRNNFILRIDNLKQELKNPKTKNLFKSKLKKEKLYYLIEIDFNYCKQNNISVKPYSKFATFNALEKSTRNLINSYQARSITNELSKHL